MTTTDVQPGDWTTRAPRSLTDKTCPQDHVITETQDRRWLWRLALDLSGRIEGTESRQLRLDLERYLADTCVHHWHDRTTDEPETRWQCLWCNRVEDGSLPFPDAPHVYISPVGGVLIETIDDTLDLGETAPPWTDAAEELVNQAGYTLAGPWIPHEDPETGHHSAWALVTRSVEVPA